MIFSIQRYLEDYFHRRGLADNDQYAVALANLYGRRRSGLSEESFLATMRKVPTVFYRNNPELDRSEFDRKLLGLLDSRFKKKKECSQGLIPTSLKNSTGRRPDHVTRVESRSRNSCLSSEGLFRLPG